jgi:hypothetical protein
MIVQGDVDIMNSIYKVSLYVMTPCIQPLAFYNYFYLAIPWEGKKKDLSCRRGIKPPIGM